MSNLDHMCVPSEINATLSAKTPSERMHYDIESESTWHLLYINCVAKYGSQITPANCDSQIIIGGGGILSYVAYTGMCHCKGMVFGLSVLNRVLNFMRICPKQGMVSTIVVIKYGLYSI